jgi:UDP-N-acetylmuramoyl-tripeptide--D-alanyl-D-alanine ligase
MLEQIKALLYFPLAYYFRFFAKIKLSRWKPRVIVITGSSGKTTLLHLIESQLGDKARYSHHANSSYGIPFDILGLERRTLMIYEWLNLFLKAPFLAFSKIPQQTIYVVEADCDRPFEGVFLSTLLKPEVTIWLSSSKTHSMNFDRLVSEGKFDNVEEAIAREYAHFLEHTSKLAIVNSDYPTINRETKRIIANVIYVSKKNYLDKYEVSEKTTKFIIKNKAYEFPAILPKASYFSIAAAKELADYLKTDFDPTFSRFVLPPGRGTVFLGVKNSIIIDSSYNASKITVLEFLDLARELKKSSGRKLVFLFGDMRELGKTAQEEHAEVAKKIDEWVDLLYCVGHQTKKFVIPNLKKTKAKWFFDSKLMGEFLKENIEQDSIILVKGSQNEIFLEEAIKFILKDPKDSDMLCRQEEYWINAKRNFFAKHS